MTEHLKDAEGRCGCMCECECVREHLFWVPSKGFIKEVIFELSPDKKLLVMLPFKGCSGQEQ